MKNFSTSAAASGSFGALSTAHFLNGHPSGKILGQQICGNRLLVLAVRGFLEAAFLTCLEIVLAHLTGKGLRPILMLSSLRSRQIRGRAIGFTARDRFSLRPFT